MPTTKADTVRSFKSCPGILYTLCVPKVVHAKIVVNKTVMPPTTSAEVRNNLTKMVIEGNSRLQIQTALNMNERTARRLIANLKRNGNLNPKKRTGRSPKLSFEDKQILIDVARENSRSTLSEIILASGLDIEVKLAAKTLKEAL